MAAAPLAARRPRAIRNRRERWIQVLSFEALGLVIVSPLFARVANASTRESLLVLIALSIAVTCWSVLFNTACDRIEYRRAGRVASDRPHGLRALHAVGQEATAVIVTWPLILALTRLGWREAVVADIGLSLTYALYGYCFHLSFDRLRPVRIEKDRKIVGLGQVRTSSGSFRAAPRGGPMRAISPSSMSGSLMD